MKPSLRVIQRPHGARLALLSAAVLASISTTVDARFAGRQMFYAGGANAYQASVLASCRTEVAAYNASNPSSNPVVAVTGAQRVTTSGTEQVNESYYCSVRFKDGATSASFGGVGGDYICPSNSSAVSVRTDGQFYRGGVACECNSGYEEEYGQCVEYSAIGTVPSGDKNAGGGEFCSLVGNPINPATGSKFLSETDYRLQTGSLALELTRSFNSVASGSALNAYFSNGLASSERPSALGRGWRHNYERYLDFDNSDVLDGAVADGSRVVVVRENGSGVTFTRQVDGSYVAEADVAHKLEATGVPTISGYRFRNADDDSTEEFSALGRLTRITARDGWSITFTYSSATTPASQAPLEGLLLQVTDNTGRNIQLFYNDAALIAEVVDAGGQAIRYDYDGLNRLTTVAYQDGSIRRYRYAEPSNLEDQPDPWGNMVPAELPHALTGITDETNKRYATYRYQADGRAISTEHGLGQEKFEFSYNSDGSVTVLDPIGTLRQYQYKVRLGNRMPAGADLACAAPGDGNQKYAQVEFDPAGNVLHRIDHNGNRTDYEHSVRNLEEKRVEGLDANGNASPSIRTISTQWHPIYRVPVRIAEPKRIVEFDHDSSGSVKSVSEWATSDSNGSLGFSATRIGLARITKFTYNTQGQVVTIDGPQSGAADATRFDYYNDTTATHAPGDLWRVINPLGHVTEYAEYDAHGQPLTVIDPNGLATHFVYDLRGRVKQVARGAEVTTIEYYDNGLKKQIVNPDQSLVNFEYDDAQRLTRLTDGYGNSIDYQLDGLGTREREEVRNPANQLVAETLRTIWPQGWIRSVEHGGRGKLNFAYEDNGNLKAVTDAASKSTTYGYDALNRVRSIAQPDTGAMARSYDGRGQLTSWSDGRGLITSIGVTGLGDTTNVSSPDAGNQVRQYDEAGNLYKRTDAKAQVTTYQYDALNRIKRIVYADGSKTVYDYDAGTHGLGRLTSVSEWNVGGVMLFERTLAYRQDGKLLNDTLALDGTGHAVAYAYDVVGRIQTLTYPSGRTVTYTYDRNGQVKDLVTQANGQAPQAVVSNATYFPFGELAAFTAGNGLVYQRSFGKDGKIESYRIGATDWLLDYDATGRIDQIGIVGLPSSQVFYGHDGAGRITSAVTQSATYGYAYDLAGNRVETTIGGARTPYGYPGVNNRVATVGSTHLSHDPNGNVTQKGALLADYGANGRLDQSTVGSVSASYQYEGGGRRVRKAGALGDRVFHYDSNNRLIAETTPGGTPLREYIYLNDTLVGVIAE